jgi:transcriptional repressor NrdR
MVCTYCSSETQVINSRHQKRTNSVWRRRKCGTCGSVFSTIERVDYEKSWVVQYQDGNLQPFLRDRLSISIYKSLQHRSTALTDAIGICMTVVSAAEKSIQNGSITATALATIVHATLLRFDKPAATMYAAYHADVL